MDVHFIAAAILLGASAFASWIAYRKGFFRRPKVGPIASPFTIGTLCLGALLFFGIQLAVGAGAFLFFRPTTATQIGWVATIGMAIASLSLIAYKGRALLKRPFASHIGIGAVAFLLAFPLSNGLGQLVEGFIGTVDDEQAVVALFRKVSEAPLLPWLMAIGIVFLGPIAEEILFRGLLQGWLRKRMGALAAILFSTLLFVLVHLSASQGLANLTLIAVLFPFSLFLGYLYERQRSLWAPITLHCLLNGLTIIGLAVGIDRF